ncbi:hypothetical protein ANN_23897 [Periplaneta americana]|uniref:Per a allergen n=1 Tax=Periplaneta americana TaxID=6978 RepID=A0ABQ8S1M2_PERAM|nr:hypothetical protein ANN_23897 [Periplaneta americana]
MAILCESGNESSGSIKAIYIKLEDLELKWKIPYGNITKMFSLVSDTLQSKTGLHKVCALRAGSQFMSGMQILAALCIRVDWKKG